MSTGNTILNFFNEEFGDVRVLMMDNNPWFVAKDLAKILGYTKLRSMYNIVGDKNKIEINPQTIEITGLPSNGATQLEQNKNVRRMILINESGLYRAIFKSKLNSAEQFQDWVTSEVLPSIRKNGGYIDQQENMTTDELMEQLVKVGAKLLEEKRALEVKCEELETDIKDKDIQIEKLSESQKFLDTFFQSKNLMSMQILAKTLCSEFPKLGRTKLMNFLREQKVLTRGNLPYQKYLNRNLFEVYHSRKIDSYGNLRYFSTPLATAKGAQFIYELVKEKYHAA